MEKVIELVDALLSQDKIRGLYLTGEAGTGKSYNVYNELNKKGVVFEKITAKITPLSLFLYLYHHNSSLIVFDDVNFTNDISIDILKGALNDDGVVHWLTTSTNKPEDVPDRFIFKGKIIIISNGTQKHTRLFYPLLSRCFTFEKGLTFEEYSSILDKIVTDEGCKSEIKQHITPFLKHFDVRLINKAIQLYKTGHKELIKDLFESDEELVWLYKHQDLTKSLLQKEYITEFGKSRRTFYRTYKKFCAIVPLK